MNLWVVTFQQRNFEDPDEFEVVGVYDDLEKAKGVYADGNWKLDEDELWVCDHWSNPHDSWTITPVVLNHGVKLS